MRLLTIFGIVTHAIITNANKEDTSTAAPTPATSASLSTLCLYVNDIKLDNMEWTSGILSDWPWSEPKGVVYVYDPQNGEEALESFRFFEFAIKNEKSSSSEDSLPTTFEFGTDDTSDNMVGCWIQPHFDEFNLRFKVYEYFSASLKAVTVINIPDTGTQKESKTVTLQTLPYKYSKVSVSMQYTWQWSKIEYSMVPTPQVQHSPPIGGSTPTNPLAKPPVDAASAAAVLFDSDERTDEIIGAGKPDGEDDNDNMQMAQDYVVGEVQSNHDAGNDESSMNSWMLFAALCSSVLGLFVLVYICIWAYKNYGRSEYDSIPTVTKVSSAQNSNLGKVRKISLRNIESQDEERRNIMHPSVSYTFDD